MGRGEDRGHGVHGCLHVANAQGSGDITTREGPEDLQIVGHAGERAGWQDEVVKYNSSVNIARIFAAD